MLRRIAVLAGLVVAVGSVARGEEFRSRERPKGKRFMVPGFPTQAAYYVLPDDFDKEKTYKLFLAFQIHNSGEEYAFGWSSFANEVDCVVASMNLTTGGSWYYSTYRRDKPHQRVASMYKCLKSKAKLSSRMFIATEGYGARVMQEFAMAYPKRVHGLAIHNPDYLVNLKWNTPKIPTLVTVSSSSSWSMNRVERMLEQARKTRYNCIVFQTVPGYSDGDEGRARELVTEFYKRCVGSPEAGVPKEVVKQFNKANELAKIGEYAEAVSLLTPIAKSSKAGDFAKRAQRLLNQIANSAQKQVEAADKVADADRDKAITMYQEVAKKFKGTPAAGRAAEKLKQLGVAVSAPDDKPSTPKPRPADSKDEQLARKLYEQGEKLLAEGKRKDALQCFRAAAIHGETRAGAEAAAKLKELERAEAPPKPQPADVKPPKPPKPKPETDAVATECDKWLGLARNYMANKRYKQATVYLKRVIRKYPDSRYAEEAKALLLDCEHP